MSESSFRSLSAALMADPLTDSTQHDFTGSSTRTQEGGMRAGRVLGEFRLLRKLGQGGMAEVWLAEQVSLARQVAVKLLKPQLMEDASYVARFQREATSAGGLNHPNIVQVHAVGESGGQHYIAQEYVKGLTLKAYLQKKGAPDLPIALHIMRQVAAALKAAGEAGIVHRDIKPENIMISRKADVKVADFGLAQLHGTREGVDITQEGTTMGTPLYMSPEQVSGSKVDPRSDIYSFGVTCFHMLTGRPPYEGPTAVSIAVKHLNDPVPLLSERRPDLPPALSTMIARMMAKNPDDRYPSADALLSDVRRLSRAVRDADRPDQVDSEALERIAPATRESQVSRRSAMVLLTLMLLGTALASAGVGWLNRPADPLASPAPVPSDIRRLDSAREQYVHAMFLGNNEDAFKAIIDGWDPVEDRLWIRQAQEQLALLYLQDQTRWDDAEKMLTTLESYGREDSRYRAQALAGQAALLAYRGQHQRARNLLDSKLNPIAGHLATGSAWQRLADETRELIQQEHNRVRSSSGPDSPAS
jgi:eukaryotic-like serine/threonine-protein kinase